jgi:TetR/AcrR family transcriptional regulator, transcriptional repressor for nem operon
MGRPQVFDEEKVIDKALEIFWHKGFNGTSTRDLIEAMGISNGSFFNSFGGKKDIYFKCLKKYNAVYITALENLLNKPMPFKTKIKNVLLEVIKKAPGKNSYEGCFFFNTSIEASIDDKEILGLTNGIHRRVENGFVSAIEMAMKNGEISKDTRSLPLARFLFNTMTGLRVLLLNSPPQATVDSIINSTLELLPL